MNTSGTRRDEQGFMLLAVVVAIFLLLLALSVAAPKVAQDLRRENEVEAIHRGDEYVRAIQLYYRKFGRYPASMDALVKSNNIRFLRQKYIDPMTGKSDWKLIHVGEAKTTVKGLFGQPLAGLPSSSGGLGANSSSASNMGDANSPGGTSSTPGLGSSSAGSSYGSPSLGSGSGSSSAGFTFSNSSSSSGGLGGGSSPLGLSPTGTNASGGSSSSSSMGGGISSQSASSFSGGGAPFVGVGIPKDGSSITVLNEQTNYGTWEFIYDPRIEQLKAKAALLGGSPANSGGGTGGTLPGFRNPPGNNTPTNTNTPSNQPSGTLPTMGTPTPQ